MTDEQLIRAYRRRCVYHPFYSGRYDPDKVARGCGGCKAVHLHWQQLEERGVTVK